MSSSYTPNLRLTLPNQGELSGAWGNTVNTGITALIENALAGLVAVSVTSAAQALTYANGSTDQARYAILQLSTTTTAAFAIYAPPAPKTYVIQNTSAYAATIYCSTTLGNTTAAGTGAIIPAGATMQVWSDGTNMSLTGATLPPGTSEFASGTRLTFVQASAPTGWTQDTSDTATNRMFVTTNTGGTGNTTGGSSSPILNNVVPAHTHNITTGTESASHTHNDSGHVHGVQPWGGNSGGGGTIQNINNSSLSGATQNTNTGYAALGTETATHVHSGTTDNGSSQTNWTPRYVYMLICQKN